MPNKILLIGRASKNIGGIATGGIAKHVEDLALNLYDIGHKTFIWDFTIQKSFVHENINIFGVSYYNKFLSLIFGVFIENIFFSRSYKNLSIRDKIIISIQSYYLRKTIKKYSFKSIHIHSLNRAVTSFINKNFPNINIVITDHGFWNKIKKGDDNRNKKTLLKIENNIKSSKTVIVISDYSIEKFKEYGLSLEKVKKIPNPIFISKIPMNSSDKKENIIFFNGFNKSLGIKNLPMLLQAININKSLYENFKLVAIVSNNAKEYIKKQKLKFEIEILGPQTWEQVVKLYNISKVLVVPSKSESFGLVYVEALAVGTPVIGFHKNIEEFQTVLKIDIGEPFDSDRESANQLSRKIQKVVSNTYDKDFMRKKVMEKYDWQSKIEEFSKIYLSDKEL